MEAVVSGPGVKGVPMAASKVGRRSRSAGQGSLRLALKRSLEEAQAKAAADARSEAEAKKAKKAAQAKARRSEARGKSAGTSASGGRRRRPRKRRRGGGGAGAAGRQRGGESKPSDVDTKAGAQAHDKKRRRGEEQGDDDDDDQESPPSKPFKIAAPAPVPTGSVAPGSAGACLCMGMFYANATQEGPQARRDRTRLVAMEKSLGYRVYSLDLTHDPKKAVFDDNSNSRHTNANWNVPRRFFNALWENFTGVLFSCVVMDYVRSPTGWTKTNITDKFYRKTLPGMTKFLTKGGRIVLPNLPGVFDNILESGEANKVFKVELVSHEQNPLVLATSYAKDAMSLQTGYTNEGEVKKLLDANRKDRKMPFVMLSLRDLEAEAAARKAKRQKRAEKKRENGAKAKKAKLRTDDTGENIAS